MMESIKWSGDNLKEVINFCGGLHESAEHWTWEQYEQVVAKDGLRVFAHNGTFNLSVGDYMVRGNVDGKLVLLCVEASTIK